MNNPLPARKSLVRKPLVSLFSVGVLCLSSIGAASAAPLLSDYFDYADGDLIAVSGGLWSISSGTTPLNVASGKAIVTTSNSQDDYRLFTPVASGSLYYGITANVTSVPGTSGSYIATMWDGDIGADTDFFGRLQVTQGTTSTKVKFGIINDSNNAPVFFGEEFDLNTTVQIVVKFDFTTMTSTLWVNPTSESSASVTDTVPAVFGGPSSTLSGIVLRQATGIGTTALDNLVVSTAFSEVVTVPEPGTVALIGLGLGAVLFGARRRVRR